MLWRRRRLSPAKQEHHHISMLSDINATLLTIFQIGQFGERHFKPKSSTLATERGRRTGRGIKAHGCCSWSWMFFALSAKMQHFILRYLWLQDKNTFSHRSRPKCTQTWTSDVWVRSLILSPSFSALFSPFFALMYRQTWLHTTEGAIN